MGSVVVGVVLVILVSYRLYRIGMLFVVVVVVSSFVVLVVVAVVYF